MKWDRRLRVYRAANGSTWSGAELLRRIVGNMDEVAESVNDGRAVEELLAIYTAHLDSGWDIPPDWWEPRQLREASRGVVPRWDDNERPIYTPRARRRK